MKRPMFVLLLLLVLLATAGAVVHQYKTGERYQEYYLEDYGIWGYAGVDITAEVQALFAGKTNARFICEPGGTYYFTYSDDSIVVPAGCILDMRGSKWHFEIDGFSQALAIGGNYAQIWGGGGTLDVDSTGSTLESGGGYGDGVCVGDYSHGVGYNNWVIRNLSITTEALDGSGVFATDDSYVGRIENVHIPANTSMLCGVELHWGNPDAIDTTGPGDGDMVTGHPHDIDIINLTVDSLGRANSRAIILSAVWNIRIWGGMVRRATTGIQIKNGDYGFAYMDTTMYSNTREGIFGQGITVNDFSAWKCVTGYSVTGDINDATYLKDALDTVNVRFPVTFTNCFTYGDSTGDGFSILMSDGVTIDRCGATEHNQGVYIGEYARGTVVSGGDFYENFSYGIGVDDISNPPDEIYIRDNRIWGNTTGGIYIDDALSVYVERNVLGDSTETAQPDGVHVDDNGSALVYLRWNKAIASGSAFRVDALANFGEWQGNTESGSGNLLRCPSATANANPDTIDVAVMHYDDISGLTGSTNADSIRGQLVQTVPGNLQNDYILKVFVSGPDTLLQWEADSVTPAEYLQASKTVDQININTNDTIIFNAVDISAGSSISLNTTTGVFTLASDKTYRLTGEITFEHTSAAVIGFAWYNITGAAAISATAIVRNQLSTGDWSSNSVMQCIITTSVTTEVSIRCVYDGDGAEDVNAGYSWAIVEVITGGSGGGGLSYFTEADAGSISILSPTAPNTMMRLDSIHSFVASDTIFFALAGDTAFMTSAEFNLGGDLVRGVNLLRGVIAIHGWAGGKLQLTADPDSSIIFSAGGIFRTNEDPDSAYQTLQAIKLLVADTVDEYSLTTAVVLRDGSQALTADWPAGDFDITGLEALEADTVTATVQLNSPLIIGGTGTTSDLSLQTTSGVGATGADMHFLVGNDGATEAMTILNNGKVGIGSQNPKSALNVKGNVPGTVGDYPAGQLIIQSPSLLSTGAAVITGYFSDIAGDPVGQLWYLGSSSTSNQDVIILNRRNANLHFGTNGSSKMVIIPDGNVGIGTTTPDEELHIYGNSVTLKLEDDTGNDGQIRVGNSQLTIEVDPADTIASSDICLKIDGAEVARFHQNSNVAIGIILIPPEKLSVVGNIATGDTTAGDVDVFHYFSTDGSWTTEYLKWDDGAAGFQLSDDLDVTGDVSATGLTIGAAAVNETELEILDGATLTTTELNYVDGVTSAIQAQLDAKQSEVMYFGKAIVVPDSVQAIIDAPIIMQVHTSWAASGITITDCGIITDNSSSYTVNFEEWTSPTDGAPATIESVATSTSYEAEDNGTIDDGAIAVGSMICVDLPTTAGTAELFVWITYTVN